MVGSNPTSDGLAGPKSSRQARGDRPTGRRPHTCLGPFVVPAVNQHVLMDARNVNMVTCGGQTTTTLLLPSIGTIEDLEAATTSV